MHSMRRSSIVWFCLIFCGFSRVSFGWSHQGHILLTRLAALRIINDPTAPQGLRDFLRQNMPHTLDECKSLATVEVVGGNLDDEPQYTSGLDGWATMPDRIQQTPEGKQPIAPYGLPESQMHFMDMEYFSQKAVYKDDLSNKPDIATIPHDVNDPRWKRSGFVPFRVEEMYHKLAEAIGPGDTIAHPDDALHAAGYLAHYTEDSTQPHHSTIDYKSVSYLVGHLKGLPGATTQPGTTTLAGMRLPRGVNPHGDIEYQLFEDAQPPRDELRKEFWTDLLAETDAQAAQRAAAPVIAVASFDPFRWDLQTLSDSYDNLPLVGRAAQAAYASGTFDPKAFFTFSGQTHGHQMTIIQLIAHQNAEAVLNVEMVYRLAWEAAHSSAAQPAAARP
jgi:hypothetical protein